MGQIMKVIWDFMQFRIMPDLIPPNGISLIQIIMGTMFIGIITWFIRGFLNND